MEPKVEICGNHATALYVFLKRHESQLDRRCRAVLNDLEKAVQRHLSIEELEQIHGHEQGNQA